MEQPQYNLLARGRVEFEYLRLYEDIGLGLTTYSPLASGVLTGKYLDGIPDGSRGALPGYEWLQHSMNNEKTKDRVRRLQAIAADLDCTLAQLSLAWCAKNPHVSTVITGASRVAQVRENLVALDVMDRLDAPTMERIEEARSAGRRRDVSSVDRLGAFPGHEPTRLGRRFGLARLGAREREAEAAGDGRAAHVGLVATDAHRGDAVERERRVGERAARARRVARPIASTCTQYPISIVAGHLRAISPNAPTSDDSSLGNRPYCHSSPIAALCRAPRSRWRWNVSRADSSSAHGIHGSRCSRLSRTARATDAGVADAAGAAARDRRRA